MSVGTGGRLPRLIPNAALALALALTLNACGGGGGATAPTPLPPAPPPTPRLTGTTTVVTELTDGGGFDYVHEVTLTETQGAPAAIKGITFVYFVGDAYYGESPSLDGPEIWIGGVALVSAGGTLRSRQVAVSDADPTEHADNVKVVVVYTSGDTDRELILSAESGPMPLPPAGSKFTLNGLTRDATSNATIRDVRIEIVSGPNTGRNTKTDRNGKYALSSLGAGTFTVRASKSGFDATTQTILFLANKPLDFTLSKTSSAGITGTLDAESLAAGSSKRLRVQVR